MFDLLQLVVAVGATKIGSDAWEAVVTEGSSLTLEKIKDALKQASAQADTAVAIRRAETSLQSRPSTAVRALLDAIDPSKCQSVYHAVRDLEQDPDGSRLRTSLRETFTLCSPQGTSPVVVVEAVEAFYVALLEALCVSKSPLRPHADLLHRNWQHEQTRAALAAARNSERARDGIAKIRRYKEAGQTSVAEALVRELEGDESISSDKLLRAELLTLSAELLENRGRPTDAASKFLEAKRLAPDADFTRTNEFRAYELLGQFPEAARVAQTLRKQHPDCVKCYVAYLRSVPTDLWRAEVANLPLDFSLDWRVPTTIASRAVAEHDGALGLEYARKAFALDASKYQPWYLVGRAIAVLHDTTTIGPLWRRRRTEPLRRSEQIHHGT